MGVQKIGPSRLRVRELSRTCVVRSNDAVQARVVRTCSFSSKIAPLAACNGARVHLPDFRVDYDLDGREAHRDVEVLTPRYRGAQAAENPGTRSIAYAKGVPSTAKISILRIGWEAGIRTPITWSRA